MKNIAQKGSIEVILSVLLLSFVLAISVGISNLMLNQIKASSQIGRSVIAFYAAEAGIERCYFNFRIKGASSCPYTDVPLDIAVGAKYTIDSSFIGSSPIISTGNYFGTNRRIELSW